MPHPTPEHVAYGSAVVVTSAFLLLLLTPADSAFAVALIAALSLALGAAAAVGLPAVRAARATAQRQGVPAAPVRSPRTGSNVRA